jgi:hypothetical protein
LAEKPKLDKGSKLARTPEIIKGGELAEMPELLWVFAFATIVWAVPLPPRFLEMTFGIVAPINLGGSWTTDILSGVIAIANALMAATGVLPGGIVMVLALTATAVAAAASTFGGGGVGVCDIVALLRESLV